MISTTTIDTIFKQYSQHQNDLNIPNAFVQILMCTDEIEQVVRWRDLFLKIIFLPYEKYKLTDVGTKLFQFWWHWHLILDCGVKVEARGVGRGVHSVGSRNYRAHNNRAAPRGAETNRRDGRISFHN